MALVRTAIRIVRLVRALALPDEPGTPDPEQIEAQLLEQARRRGELGMATSARGAQPACRRCHTRAPQPFTAQP